MTITSLYYERTAETLIKNLQKRHIEGHYVSSKEEAIQKAFSFLKNSELISWGGSMTLAEIGLIPALEAAGCYTLLDRSKVPNEQVEELYHRAFFADTYFMSTNAITLEGELINIDGTGNRVASLIYGPKQVIIIAGMNKVARNQTEALSRIHNVACPQNAIRLSKNTPCALTGICHDCLSPDCICMQTVITRNSKPAGRIKVILVGENLGY